MLTEGLAREQTFSERSRTPREASKVKFKKEKMRMG